jgi:RNase H-like domain found in reverse transcriptase/Reverse transcriptase (RNA-dependent DNA polymerase)/Integrase zinc binding domain
MQSQIKGQFKAEPPELMEIGSGVVAVLEGSTSDTLFRNLHARAWVGDCSVCTLLDTGASLSCASGDMLERLRQANPRLDVQPWPVNHGVRTANGAPIEVIGWSLVPVRLVESGCDEKVRIVFVKDLGYDVLLGTDAIAKLRLRLDFDRNTIAMPTGAELPFSLVGEHTCWTAAALEPLEIAEMHVEDDADLPEPVEQTAELDLRKLLRDKVAESTAPEKFKAKLAALLQKYWKLFTTDGGDGTTARIEHRIDTSMSRPLANTVRRMSPPMLDILRTEVSKLLATGVAEEAQTPWAASPVLVKKKNGEHRLAIDYRRLNQVTKSDAYPIQSIQSILDAMDGSKVFTSLDLCNGYFQVHVAPEDREKTGFVTPFGTYQFRRMPFGLKNAPATFARLMNTVLRGLPFVLVYMDDIIIHSKNWDEHIEHLEAVFQKLQDANLKLKLAKCNFGMLAVLFLGHQVSGDGVATDKAKLEKLQSLPKPTDVSSVRRFLGLASYYRRFVPDFADVAVPLTNLTKKKVAFNWTEECQNAFDKIKDLLVKAPVLAFPAFDREFILHCDASDAGLGAVLSQLDADGAERPIAFASRVLEPRESNYSATERELLALVWAYNHFKPYLFRARFKAFTDHNALLWLSTSFESNPRLTRWWLLLSELDFELKYRPGAENIPPDILSRDAEGIKAAAQALQARRKDAKAAIVAVMTRRSKAEAAKKSADVAQQPAAPAPDQPEVQPEEREDEEEAQLRKWADLQRQDTALQKLFEAKPEDFKTIQGVLFKRFAPVRPDQTEALRAVVPAQCRADVLKECHDSSAAGHFGRVRTVERVQQRYWWPSVHRDCEHWVQTCQPCNERRDARGKVFGELQSIVPNGTFCMMGMDFVGPFPTTPRGNKYLLVCTLYAERYAFAFALPDATANSVAAVLVERIFPLIGTVDKILTDQGQAFKATLIKEICDLLNVQKVTTSSFHPQCNGLTERLNGTLTNALSKLVDQGQLDWDMLVPHVCFAYNITPQASLNESPYFLVFGRDARWPTSLVPEARFASATKFKSVFEFRQQFVQNVSTARAAALESLANQQSKQQRDYNRNHRPHTFSLLDLVWLKLPQPLDGHRNKLSRKWAGPFRITHLTDNVASLQHSRTFAALRQRIHVSRLKPYFARHSDFVNDEPDAAPGVAAFNPAGEEPEALVDDCVGD